MNIATFIEGLNITFDYKTTPEEIYIYKKKHIDINQLLFDKLSRAIVLYGKVDIKHIFIRTQT